MSWPLGWRQVQMRTHRCAHFFVEIVRAGKPRVLSMCRSTEVHPKWLVKREDQPICLTCMEALEASVAPWAEEALVELMDASIG